MLKIEVQYGANGINVYTDAADAHHQAGLMAAAFGCVTLVTSCARVGGQYKPDGSLERTRTWFDFYMAPDTDEESREEREVAVYLTNVKYHDRPVNFVRPAL